MISDHTIHLGWTAYVSALILGNFTLSNYNIWRSFTISESSLYWVFDVSNRVRQGFVAPFGHGGWFRTIAEFDFLANLQPLWANSLSLSIGKYFMRDLETQWFEHTIHLGWSVYVCSALILVHIIWSNFNTLRGFSSPESLVFGWFVKSMRRSMSKPSGQSESATFSFFERILCLFQLGSISWVYVCLHVIFVWAILLLLSNDISILRPTHLHKGGGDISRRSYKFIHSRPRPFSG